jgi:DNA primase
MDLMSNYKSEEENDLEELKATINDYNKLKVNLTNKIGRIRSTYL